MSKRYRAQYAGRMSEGRYADAWRGVERALGGIDAECDVEDDYARRVAIVHGTPATERLPRRRESTPAGRYHGVHGDSTPDVPHVQDVVTGTPVALANVRAEAAQERARAVQDYIARREARRLANRAARARRK